MIFTPYDVLNIPAAVSLPFAVVKSIAYILLPILFVLHVLQWTIYASQTNAQPSGGSNWYRTIFRVMLIFVALAWYRHIFMKIVALSETIAMTLAQYSDISELIMLITKQSESYVENAIGGTTGKVLGSIAGIANILRPKVFMLAFLATAVSIAEPILLTIRYVLLSILYVFGPLAIVGNMFRYTKVLLRGWFTNLLQISFWIVMLRILEAVMLTLQIESLAKQGHFTDIIAWTIICTIFLGLIILTPIITAKILSGENLGEVGSIAVAAVTAITSKYAAPVVKVAKGIKNTGAAVKCHYTNWRSRKSSDNSTQPKPSPRR